MDLNKCSLPLSKGTCSVITDNCTLSSLKSCDAIEGWRQCHRNESVVPVVTICLLVVSVTLFVLLILRDAWKGLKSKAHWIPGDFLVLSALTIQLLNLISTQGQPLNWEKRDILLVEFWMIHTSRVLLCVVIGYLIPAMANPGADDFWGKILTLALTVFLHVISELYFIKPSSASDILKSLWPRQQGTSITLYYILAGFMFSSFVLLLLLLGCSNIAGRGIERIVANRTPIILEGKLKEGHPHSQAEEDQSSCKECWKSVEDSVFRAWVISRAYSLEYVLARSPLAASTATIVTVQIAITILAGVMKSPKLLMCIFLDQLRFAITLLQCVFILMGWSMILWRWVTAVAYYGNRSSSFHIEDFWTRHLKELQEAKHNELPKAQLLEAKIVKLVVNQSTKLSLHRYLLYVVIWVQFVMVSFSKACWLPSLKIYHGLLSWVLSTRQKVSPGDIPRDIEHMLDGVQMLGETTESLWLSNRRSIPQAKNLIEEGETDGKEKRNHLVEYVASNRTGAGLGLRCLDPSKQEPRLKYLCQNISTADGEQITEMSRKAWKMTAVSLMTIIARLSGIRGHPGEKAMKDCLDAYSEAWDIIDFVDMADEEEGSTTREVGEEIISEAADKYFSAVLKKEAQNENFLSMCLTKQEDPLNGSVPFPHSEDEKDPRNVPQALAPLKRKCKGKTETPGGMNASALKEKGKPLASSHLTGSDSTDWKEAAWYKSVYTLCSSIDYNEDTDVNGLVKELESCLADILEKCLNKTQHLLLLNCRKWALNNGERKIAKALYTAGKAKMLTLNTSDTSS